MALTALTDGAGRSFVDPVSGRMLVIPPPPLLAAALFAGVGALTGDATVVPRPPPVTISTAGYVPLNAFVRRTIVRKRR